MKLNTAMTANAIFSSLSALTMYFMSDWLSKQINTPHWLWLSFEIGLLLFSLQLILMVKYKKLAHKLIKQVVAADISWVAGTLTALLIFTDSFSLIGMSILIFINLIVSLLAWLQYSAYKIEQDAI